MQQLKKLLRSAADSQQHLKDSKNEADLQSQSKNASEVPKGSAKVFKYILILTNAILCLYNGLSLLLPLLVCRLLHPSSLMRKRSS